MKKVFISIPMNGRTDEEIEKDKDFAIAKIKEKFPEEELEIVNTIVKEDPPEDTKNIPVWYLGKSLEILSTADIAYFCKGWNSKRGCRLENQAAYAYSIECIEEW